MSEKIEAKVTHLFRADPDTLYRALVDPQIVRRWQQAWLNHDGGTGELTKFDFDPRVGGNYTITGHRDGEESRSWGTFLALEPPNKLAYTFIVDASEEDDPSVVTIIVEPAPDDTGSVVTLYNSMDAQWANYLPQTERAWQHMLDAIDQVLQSNPDA